MKPGNNKFIFLIFFSFLYSLSSFAEDKILSTPLINLEKLKPSFEEEEYNANDKIEGEVILNKKNILPKDILSSAKFIGLDKITAKTSEIIVKLGGVSKFGPLEIKVLKCGKVSSGNLNDNVAYVQVKDLSKNEDEKIFIFNGWTFSSDPTISPFDHAIYDLQLVECNNV